MTEATLKAITLQGGAISSQDFDSLRALVRLCPIGQKEGASVGAVAAYYFLLTGLYVIFSRICEAFADWAERERRRCTYFVAVALDRRIANARNLWAEQMIEPEKQEKSSPSLT